MKGLKLKYLGIIAFLIGGFFLARVVESKLPLETVKYELISYSARPGSIWDVTGKGGPLYQKGSIWVVVKSDNKEAAGIFSKILTSSLQKEGLKVVCGGGRRLLAKISGFSTRRWLGVYSIKKSAEEVATEVAKKIFQEN